MPTEPGADGGEKGKFVIIKDLAVILPGTVLSEATVVPSMSVWGGNPGDSSFRSMGWDVG